MEQILEIVRNISIFILFFTIITNLFSRTKYARYFKFVEGLLVIILVMTPLFTWLTSEKFLEDCLDKNLLEMEEQSYDMELEMIGKEREQLIMEELTKGGQAEDE